MTIIEDSVAKNPNDPTDLIHRLQLSVSVREGERVSVWVNKESIKEAIAELSSLRTEIDRLENELVTANLAASAANIALKSAQDELKTAIAAVRAEHKRTLQYCARIADQYRGCYGWLIAESIRALAEDSDRCP